MLLEEIKEILQEPEIVFSLTNGQNFEYTLLTKETSYYLSQAIKKRKK